MDAHEAAQARREVAASDSASSAAGGVATHLLAGEPWAREYFEGDVGSAARFSEARGPAAETAGGDGGASIIAGAVRRRALPVPGAPTGGESVGASLPLGSVWRLAWARLRAPIKRSMERGERRRRPMTQGGTAAEAS